MSKIVVTGTTSWGTTLAILLANNGHDVTLLARSASEAQNLETSRQNARFLPELLFPPTMHVSDSIEYATDGAAMAIIAVPSNTLRDNVKALAPYLDKHTILLSATKGLEKGSSMRMSQVIEEELPKANLDNIAVLSGPNLAKEVAIRIPTSTVIASKDITVAQTIQAFLTSSSFRVYTNTDIIGVELGGALKNVIAIGAGISDGLGYGNNSKAAFITRGLAEITRLGKSAGADPLTFAGLAGLGDLVATCYSNLSRNRYVGHQLGEGYKLQDILSSMNNVAAGIDTTEAMMKLSGKLGISMPITEAIHSVVFNQMDPKQAVMQLMERTALAE